MAGMWYSLAPLVVALLSTAQGAKFLGIFPIPATSHNAVFTALTRELARRGHHVTVISSFPEKTPVPNLTNIVVKMALDDECKFTVPA
jgi:glucuronosyltransferase